MTSKQSFNIAKSKYFIKFEIEFIIINEKPFLNNF